MPDIPATDGKRTLTGALIDRSDMAAEILDANPVSCFVIDAQHRVIHWNKGCEQLLGISASDIIGTDHQWQPFYASRRPTLADFIVDERIDEIASTLYQGKGLRHSMVIAGAYEAEAFFPHLGTDGRHLFFTAAPIRNASGEIIGAVETLQDVSAQRQAEAALQTSHDRLEREVALRTAELAESNRQLAGSLEKAEAANRIKSAFLDTISHELKTPLNGIIGIAELIRKDPGAAETSEFAAIIHESGLHLFKHLSNMLSLIEIEADEARTSISPNSTRELIESVVGEHQSSADEKGIALETILLTTLPEIINSDALRLSGILASLIENAVKFTDRGSIKVLAEGNGNNLLVTVSDTGPGIPAELQTAVFEKFRHADKSVFQHDGSIGLGLALARAQAQLLGGSLILDTPAIDRGASFILRIPSQLPG